MKTRVQAEEVFRPGRPVSSRYFLVGRDGQLRRVRAHLRSGGRAPVVTGARGIGKTSLGRIAAKDFEEQVATQCHIKTTFSSWAKDLLGKLSIDTDVVESAHEESIAGDVGVNLGFKSAFTSSKKSSSRRTGLGGADVSPPVLYRSLVALDRPLIILVDEFDRIPKYDKDSIGLFADFVKLLANNADEHALRILFMGVSASAQRLFSGHESIKRNVASFHLRRLSKAAIGKFMLRAAAQLGIDFTPEVVRNFQDHAMGFPHYIHLVGWNCCAECSEGATITGIQYEKAVDEALDELLGLDSRWDFIRRRNTDAGDAVLMLLVADHDARLELDKVVERLGGLKYDGSEVRQSVSALEKQGVVRLSRLKGRLHPSPRVSIAEPEMVPFLAANFRRERYTGSRQLRLDFPTGADHPVFAED